MINRNTPPARPGAAGGFFLLAVACMGLAGVPARAQEDAWGAGGVPLKGSRKFLAAFREVVAPARRSTVRVLCEGKDVALGTVVGADGWVLTKASELKGKPVCRLADG